MTHEKVSFGEDEIAEQFQTVQELVREARLKLTPKAWDFLVGGSDSETTIVRNRVGLDSLTVRPRMLRDAVVVDTSSSLLGHRLEIPVVLAPIGGYTLFNADAA